MLFGRHSSNFLYAYKHAPGGYDDDEMSIVERFYRHEREVWYQYVVSETQDEKAVLKRLSVLPELPEDDSDGNLARGDSGPARPMGDQTEEGPYILELRSQNVFGQPNSHNLNEISDRYEQRPNANFILAVFQELVLSVTDGHQCLYRVILSEEMLKKHKEATGIEGSWQSYFELLK